MRAAEFIRELLNLFDGDAIPAPDQEMPNNQFYDDDIRRFRQIVDLQDSGEETQYSNTPKEEYAAPEAVTSAAGGGPNKPKHPDDIRGNSFKIYRGAD